MNSSKDITIVAVSDIKIKKTINAILTSSKKLDPLESIFFTSKSINISSYQSTFMKKVNINPINSLKDYSNFIIYSLHKYITTKYVLIVQWDGFICNIKKWDPKFLDFDYVGAPFVPRFKDLNYAKDKEGRFYVVGNGGFSLRSKKLLESASKFNLKDDKLFTNFHEDGFYCVLHRNLLESKGFTWSTFEIAKKFSIEIPLSIKDISDLPFGFHGKKMLLLILIKRLFNTITLKPLNLCNLLINS
tara:strand:- start:12 stop:746 length:735 start_codon:yes stop_codon:yes gene_type:complete